MNRPDERYRVRRAALVALPLALLAYGAWAQLSVRPEDPLGVAIRERRVRVIHSDTPEVPGTSMHLQQADPWLAYQRGRSYYFHEWGREDGAFNWLPDRPQSGQTTSCGMCHNLPFPSLGSGGNAASQMGVGKNAPHFFGGGLLETISIQVRQQILAEHDKNRNGYLDVPAETRGRRALVEAAPGVKVDFGSLEDQDGNGRPDLNSAMLVVLVDDQGERLLLNSEGRVALLSEPGIVGFDLIVGAFASSSGDHQFSSMRVFSTGVLNNIMGILPDVAVVPGPRQGYWLKAWGRYTNAGAFQTDLALTADPRATPDPTGRGTIGQGELDLFEWYMMNHPSPALGPQDDETRRGRALLATLGCTSCHVAKWQIKPADPELGYPGDRRFFDLAVAHNPATGRLEGKLRPLTREVAAASGEKLQVPRREGFAVEDVYTDLVHHDLGERFWEYTYTAKGQFYVTKRFRTPPLWGIGSSGPYGHDGLSPTLDDVIRRHGGEAEESARAYARAKAADRAAVVAFLDSLVLYQPETLPTDMNGDGRIDTAYQVAGVELGPERFQPELKFRTAPRYRGWTTGPDGERFFSFALLNVAEAYGETLPALLDADRDSVPDMAEAQAAGAPAAGAEQGGTGRR